MYITHYENFKQSATCGAKIELENYILNYSTKSYQSKFNYITLLQRKSNILIDNIREGKKELKRYKVSSNCIIPTGYFTSNIRNINNFEYNGNVYIDIDIKNAISNYSDAVDFTKLLFDTIKQLNINYIKLINISFSDAGLSILVTTNGNDLHQYKKYHQIVVNNILCELKAVLTESQMKIVSDAIDYRNVTSLMILTTKSTDDILYNDNTVAYDVINNNTIINKISSVKYIRLNDDTKINLSNVAERRISISLNAKNKIWNKVIGKYGKFQPGNRTNSLVLFFSTLNAIGVSLSESIEYLETKFKMNELGDDYMFIGTDVYNRYKNQTGILDFKTFTVTKDKTTDVTNYKYNSIFESEIDEHFHVKDYISNSDISSTLTKKFENGTHILYAPTGVGKTTFVKNMTGKKIIIVPTNIAIEQNATNDTTMYYSKNTKLDLTKDTIITNYQNAANLLKRVDNVNNYLIVFDEAHNLFAATNTSFLNKVMSEIFQYLDFNYHNRLLFLTATPVANYLTEYKIPTVTKITSDKIRAKRNVKSVKISNFYKFVFNSINNKLDNNTNDLFVVYCNNTSKKLTELIENFKKVNVSDDEILILNSHTKDTDTVSNLIKTNKLSENIKVVISTSIINESININNDYDNVYTYLFDTVHAIIIEQLASRFRNAKEITLFRKHIDTVSINELIDIDTKTNKILSFVRRNNEYHNDNFKSQIEPISGKHYVELYSSNYQIWNKYTNQIDINFMYINYELYQLDAYNINNCFELYEWYLSKYNWNVQIVDGSVEYDDTQHVLEFDTISKQSYKEHLTDMAITMNKTFTKMSVSEFLSINPNDKYSDSEQIKYYFNIKGLLQKGFNYVDAIRFMTNSISYSTQKWNNLLKSLDIYAIIHSKQFVNSTNNVTINEIKTLFSKIKVNKEYTPNELTKLTKSTLRSFKFTDKEAARFIHRIISIKQVHSHTVYKHSIKNITLTPIEYKKVPKTEKVGFKRKVYNNYLIVSKNIFDDYIIDYSKNINIRENLPEI